ncbi:hypothetical protein KA089_02065, partial [Candidatus Woesebacteria bacterium]|nr:hypothetical protein [Candidatus Woesebacteria bacterium]
MATANKTNTSAFAAAMSGSLRPEITEVGASAERAKLNPFAQALSSGSNGGGERTFASAIGAGFNINPEEAQTEQGRKALEIAQIAERNRAKMASEASAQQVVFDKERQTTAARIEELRQIFLQTATQNATTKAKMKTSVGYAAVSTFKATSIGGGAGLKSWFESRIVDARIFTISASSGELGMEIMKTKSIKKGPGAAMA